MEGYRRLITFSEDTEGTIVFYNQEESSYAIPLENSTEPSKTLQGRPWVNIKNVNNKRCLIVGIGKMWTRQDRNEYMRRVLVPIGLSKEYEVITMH